jgi:sugar phosphate isomerase/epimerase
MNVRFGLVHYATFPESLTGLGAFRRALETSARGRAWDVIELSTQLPRAWTTAARDLGLPPGTSLYLSAGPEMLAWRHALNAESRTSRARAVDRARELVDRAVEAGAENLMLTSGPIARGARSWGPLTESLRQVCEHAASASGGRLGVSVETFETLAIQRQYLGPTPLALWLMETLRREHLPFRVTLDLSHVLQLGEDLGESLAAGRGQVRHLHLSCCVLRPGDQLWGDRHLSFGTPGAHPTFAETSGALARWASGFDADVDGHAGGPAPVVSMEVRPLPGEDPALVHGRCVRAINRISRGAGLRRASAQTTPAEPAPGEPPPGKAALLQPSEAQATPGLIQASEAPA